MRPHSCDEVSALVGLIYDAALDPGLWPEFLARLAQAIRGTTTVLFVQDLSSQRGNVTAAVQVDPSLQREYEQYYAAKNVWLLKGAHLLKPGRVVTGQMVCTDAELERTEYYNDYLRRLDVFHSFGAVAHAERAVTSILTSFRPKGGGPFEGQDLKLLEFLLPHVRQSLQVHGRLAVADLQREASLAALDRLGNGVILLSKEGRVVFANRAAHAIVAARDGLMLTRDGAIAASVGRESRDLGGVIARAGDGDHDKACAHALRLSRPSGKRDLVVFAIPIAHHAAIAAHLSSHASVMLVITGDEVHPEADTSHLRSLYGLTATEARVARLFVGGLTVGGVSERLGTTPHTVRWHLKHIFQKTGTRSQSDLVRQLLLIDSSTFLRSPPD